LAQPAPLPRIAWKEGRAALLVDSQPYLMLAAQAHNSSAWPALLPKVWPVAHQMQANTVELPVYWEQVEPAPGRYDFSVVDTLLREARQEKLRLVLLWFGTWKNASSRYIPLWMKADPRYERVRRADGKTVDSPSPFAAGLLEADAKAFAALMRHLAQADPQRTVLMVQVENEAGTYGSVRDHGAAAEKAFQAAVPAEILKAMNQPAAAKSWTEAFGKDADEYFHAWAVASAIQRVAAAGKAEYNLPLFTNAALRDPIQPGPASTYESGGPTDNVIPIYRAAAPALDLVAPDIYQDDYTKYLRVCDLYARPNNPLLIPETGNSFATARFFYAALAKGALGWAPFGMDLSGYNNFPLGAPEVDKELIENYALNYRLAGPLMRNLAEWQWEGRLSASAENPAQHVERIPLGAWTAVVTYGLPAFGFPNNPKGNPKPSGRALIVRLSENEFLVSGYFCRVDFEATAPARREYLRVEEGLYQGKTFTPARIWSGDQTDWGLNFNSQTQLLRVRLGSW